VHLQEIRSIGKLLEDAGEGLYRVDDNRAVENVFRDRFFIFLELGTAPLATRA
jgi:hypothetical protein